jgi:hypothetical protein
MGEAPNIEIGPVHEEHLSTASRALAHWPSQTRPVYSMVEFLEIEPAPFKEEHFIHCKLSGAIATKNKTPLHG